MWAVVDLASKAIAIPEAERSVLREGDSDFSVDLLEVKEARGGVVSGGVLHHGTQEEDGPVTREALVFPRENPVDGEPVIHLQSRPVCRRTGRSSKHRQRRRGTCWERGPG